MRLEREREREREEKTKQKQPTKMVQFIWTLSIFLLVFPSHGMFYSRAHTPFGKIEKGSGNSAIQRFVPRGLYSARQSDCRVQMRHVNRFVTDLCTSWCCAV